MYILFFQDVFQDVFQDLRFLQRARVVCYQKLQVSSMRKFYFTLSYLLFCGFLSCSAICRGECIKIYSRQWQAYFEAPSELSSRRYSSPEEDDSIDYSSNIRCVQDECENSMGSHTFLPPDGTLTGQVDGEMHQVLCTTHESWFSLLWCRLVGLFTHLPLACFYAITLEYSDAAAIPAEY